MRMGGWQAGLRFSASRLSRKWAPETRCWQAVLSVMGQSCFPPSRLPRWQILCNLAVGLLGLPLHRTLIEDSWQPVTLLVCADETFTVSVEAEWTWTDFQLWAQLGGFLILTRKLWDRVEVSQRLHKDNLLLDFLLAIVKMFSLHPASLHHPSGLADVDFYRGQSSFTIGSVFFS